MLTKRFLPAFFILCVLLVGCAFAASSEQPKDEVFPESPGMITSSAILDVAVENISIVDPANANAPLYALLLAVGQEKQLGVVVSPDNATNPRVTWTSSNESVVLVHQTGLVEAKAGGDARITATSQENAGVFEYCDVYVANAPVPVTEVKINKEEIGILSGYTDELTATVLPPHADLRHISWHSSNPEIVAIDPTMRTGNRTRLLTAGLYTGTAIISAVSNYSGERGGERPFATCMVHHYVEGPRSTEGGCSAASAPGLLGLLLLAPLLFFLKK
jgi:hypothetical protein